MLRSVIHMTKSSPSRGPSAPEPESLDELRGDCARMADRWTGAHKEDGKKDSRKDSVSPAMLHGVTVPQRSAKLLDGMSDYGD